MWGEKSCTVANSAKTLKDGCSITDFYRIKFQRLNIEKKTLFPGTKNESPKLTGKKAVL